VRVGAGDERCQIGPFLATFTRPSPHPAVDYVVPDDGANPAPHDIAMLVEAFHARGLWPRLEYVPDAPPGLADRLAASGFTVDARLPLWIGRAAA
jgi:hypothetical protein